MNGYEAELKRLFRQHGWRKTPLGKGSHELWERDGYKAQTIPYGCKSRHLANKLLKQAGIKHRFD